jgi:glucuronoarabinoxylan endo-1,4-beta-xylanase
MTGFKKFVAVCSAAAICTCGTLANAAAALQGDTNNDGRIDSLDVVKCRKALLNSFSGGSVDRLTDIDGNGATEINDLVLLTRYVLGKTKVFPQTSQTTTTTTTYSQTTTTTTTYTNGESYMQKIAKDIQIHEDPSVTVRNGGVDYGTIEKKTYYSKDACRQKNLNILLPPGYDPSQSYPVLYVFHGIFGSEDSMIDENMKIQTMLGNLIAKGEAEKMIVVFPQMFTTSDNSLFPAFTNESSRAYDAIREDLENSIMPFMKENYSVKEGRENTAVTGFSMGGREALYVGLTRPEIYGYVGSICAAPGIFATVDGNMTHEGSIPESEFGVKAKSTPPYVILISAAKYDGTVGQHPESYHKALESKGVEHIWHEIPDGGHGETSVRPHMYNFLRYIFKAK